MRQPIQSAGAPSILPFPEPATIQPHGALLAIDHAGCVASLAGAADRLFGRTPHDLLGIPLADAPGTPGNPLPAIPPDLTIHPRHVGSWLDRDHGRWDVSAHRSGSYTLLEFEPAPADEPHAAVALAAIHRACAAFDACADVQAACAACARALRHLTGYDRVAIGRFVAGTAVVTAAVEEAAPASLPPLDGVLPPPFA